MRILMVSTTYPRWGGDTRPRFVHDLAAFLAKEGMEIIVLSPHHKGAKFHEYLDGVEIYRHPYFLPTGCQKLCCGGGIRENIRHSLLARIQLPLLAVTQSIYLLALTMKKKPDLIHSHWILPQGLNAMMASKLFGIDYVVTVHGADIFPTKFKVMKLLSKAVLSNAASVSANSDRTKKEAQNLMAGKEITVIPMGADVSRFKPVSGKSASKSVLFVGRLAQVKGVEYLIRAFKKIKEKNATAKLIIVGEGEELPRLMDEARKTGYDKDISFEGAIPHERIFDYYGRAGVLALPSIVDSEGSMEGLGVVLTEALACGVPAVATDAGGISDIIKDGQTGLIVPQKDPEKLAQAIDRIFSDTDLAERLAQNGRMAILSRFSWNVISQRYSTLYSDILRERIKRRQIL